MHKRPRDFLLTYDPSYVEQHPDSSDFEDFPLPVVASKSGNHCLLKKKKQNKIKKENGFNNQQILANLYANYKRQADVKEEYVWETETVLTSKTFSKKELTDTQMNTKNLSRGDEIETIRSKRSLFRHKVIPCLSSIFGRSSNTTRHMTVITENPPVKRSADNSCQVERKWRKESKRERCYAVQPIYAVEGNIHGMPFKEIKLTQPKCHNCKNQFSNTSLSLTSSSGREAKGKKFKERLQAELKKEHIKHKNGKKENQTNQKQQFTTKPSKSSYQIYQQTTRSMATTPTDSFSRLPSTASGFWDYICDKLNRKYPHQPIEVQQYGCTCSSPTTDPACSPENCTVLQASKPRPEAPACCNRSQPPPSTDNSCSCAMSPAQEFMGKCYSQNLPQGPTPQPPKPGLPPYQYANKKKEQPAEKVECQCYPEKLPRKQPSGASKSPASASGSLQPSEPKKPCQEPHHTVTNALASKYNGEILCIHNPPCVLINGCLNLPPPKDQAPVSLWPVTQGKKPSFYHLYKRNKRSKKKSCDQSCQYHTPYVEVQQCQTSFYKDEKVTQSLCNHDPPCEMIRSCYRDKFNPKLMNSCIHVPICDRQPKCSFDRDSQSPTKLIDYKQSPLKSTDYSRSPLKLMDNRQSPPKSFDRSPRNEEIPTDHKNYTVMTVGTQVKPKAKMCRHKPACPKIPKCLENVWCDSYLAMPRIPMCAHEPSCEIVPTCFKKNHKEMVSVYSQYPNGCRVA